jgi:transcriptional/translational regulatory protein YebC/TACO1
MSGHSHWHSIKYAKGLADKRKGLALSKMAREITLIQNSSWRLKKPEVLICLPTI